MAGWTADDNNLNTTLVLAQMSVFYVCVCVCVCVCMYVSCMVVTSNLNSFRYCSPFKTSYLSRNRSL